MPVRYSKVCIARDPLLPPMHRLKGREPTSQTDGDTPAHPPPPPHHVRYLCPFFLSSISSPSPTTSTTTTTDTNITTLASTVVHPPASPIDLLSIANPDHLRMAFGRVAISKCMCACSSLLSVTFYVIVRARFLLPGEHCSIASFILEAMRHAHSSFN